MTKEVQNSENQVGQPSNFLFIITDLSSATWPVTNFYFGKFILASNIPWHYHIVWIGITTPLITTSSGDKMGKTNKGAIWLSEKLLSSNGYWQFWRNVDDKDVIRFLKIFTDLNTEDINKLKNNSASEINNNKIILADETTNLCHGKNIADSFVIKKNDLIKGIEAFKIISLNKKIIQSNSEARRLIRGGAVKFDGKIINDEVKTFFKKDFKKNKIEISVGKKNHFVIKII